MSGTNPAATWAATNNATQLASSYKANIDADIAVAQRIVDCFAPRQTTTPAMTLTVDPGHVFTGTTLVEKAAQTTGTITAPGSNSRIDRVVINRTTGVISTITGTPGVSPTAPAITAGNAPCAQILLTSTSTSIVNSMITDERDMTLLGSPAENQVTLASATTTDLGTALSNNILITGTTAISSFGSSASTEAPLYFVKFASAGLGLSYNATSMILPTGATLFTQAGDNATLLYLGSGNWQVVDYQRANGVSLSVAGTVTSIASATTTDLGTIASNFLQVTGTTTITSLGSSAQANNPVYFVRFNGALTLTYNATSLILPGSANITTAAGDFGVFQYLGSGNWQCLAYNPANGAALSGGGIKYSSGQLTSGTTWTSPAGITASTIVKITGCGGGGGGGGTNGSSAVGAGGGAGGAATIWVTGLAASTAYTIAIGGGGTAGANTGGNGGTGGNTTIAIGANTYTFSGGVGGLGTTSATACRNAAQGATTLTGASDSLIYYQTNGAMGAANGTISVGGGGASLPWGTGGFGGLTAVSGAGTNGTGQGAGGGGALGATAAGGTGSAGFLLIEI